MRRTMFAALSAAAITASLLTATASPAGAAPGDPSPPQSGSAKGEPALRTPATSEADKCTLRSANRSEHHEWTSCIAVTAALSSAPAIGGTAELSIEVRAAVARPDTEITIELPDGLSFSQMPASFSTSAARQTDGTGSATLAAATTDLAADGVVSYTASIRADAAGLAQIRVRATATAPWGTDAGADDVFITIGADGSSSRIGGETPPTGGVATAPGVPQARETGRTAKVATVDATPFTDDAAAGPDSEEANTCATGIWSYFDEDSALRPSINYQVQAWDADSPSEDDLLATGVTSFSGGYNLCFDGADGEGGGQEVYIKFISSNSTWRVRDTPGGNNDYINSTPAVSVCDGCLHDFGSLIPGNDIHRGMHAFDSANDMWVWLPNTCWDLIGACRQAVINWTTTSTDGTYYSLGGNDVHLAADDPNAPHTVVHELTHSTMDDTYEDDYPPIPNCSPHFIEGTSSTGCAWTEGFAEWVPASVYNDPFYRWPSGASLNLETPTWGTAGWNSGDSTEGRVAGALIDISDSANEATWDRFAEGDPGNIWTTFQNHVNDTFFGFWLSRSGDGFNVASSGALASVYQNTIDYSFRDPLTDYATLNRPTPNPHNFSFNTNVGYWSTVAVRPNAAADYDISLYDDFGQGVFVGGSSFGASTIDFVSVDSNHRALGDYYPRVNAFSGTGSYDVELAQRALTASPGVQTIAMGSAEVVAARDIFLTARVPVTVRVVPANSGQDVEAFLMGSDPADSSTWVRARANALVSASASGAGAAEQFTFTPGADDWYGLVLTNKTGSGNYTVIIDTTAPTGAVVINDGDADTTKRTVTLTHSAADAETGVESMRVSVDGTLDSEPWVAYAASSQVDLLGDTGTKTVHTQYRNPVGLVSATASDTIMLDLRPDLRTTEVSDPPANRDRGQTFSITDTVKNFGRQKASASITNFYLSTNKQLDGNDIKFTAIRDVPALKKNKVSTGSTTVTVKNSTPLDRYFVLACSDNTDAVGEAREDNNCKASATKIKINAATPLTPGLLR